MGTGPYVGGMGSAARMARGKVLPEHARRHNRSLVLNTLFHDAPMSRADLARATGLTRVTVSALVAELLDEHLVMETGLRDDVRPGKPATLIDVDPQSLCIITLDLSGNEALIGARLSLRGDIVHRETVPRPVDAGEILDAVLGLASGLVTGSPSRVLGVGVGTPGIVDEAGRVLSAPNFGWEGLDLAGTMHERLGVPVTVVNDANAAVLGEFTFAGAAQNALLIRIGKGVGSGLLTDGQLVRGAHLAGGELGHVTVGTDGGPRCACGKIGCLEAWLSEAALAAHSDAERPGARAAALHEAGDRLGIALAPVVGVLDISEIILSGPPELLDGELRNSVTNTLRSRTLTRFHDSVEVRMAQQGDDIVLRGAAVPVLTTQLGVY